MAGLASVPSAFTARTRKVWSPTARPVSSFGEEHAPNAAPSSEHSKVEPGLLAENVKEAAVASVEPDGPESIVVSGGSGAASGEQPVLPVSVKLLPSWAMKRQS